MRFALLSVLGVLISIPFFWMLSTSFKPRVEAENPDILPGNPTVQNYPVVLDIKPDPSTNRFLGMRYGRWYFNTFFVAVGITFLQVLTSSMAAYASSRSNCSGSRPKAGGYLRVVGGLAESGAWARVTRC
jgi:multiple sugar transport system permease protein